MLAGLLVLLVVLDTFVTGYELHAVRSMRREYRRVLASLADLREHQTSTTDMLSDLCERCFTDRPDAGMGD